ncbi:MAG TPA: aldolase/citrate lyase family protein [Burkholderiales bacterium]|nr:aldolase/citrate lyase family protein [Burkholderiales bacterium]
MRDNPVKTKLLSGQPVFGTFGWEFMVPGLPQIVKAAGAEFLLLDMEHSGAGFDTVKTQTQLCRGIDLVPLARVPANQYTYIARALDCGAMGIMAPMVGSAEEARFIVSCTRYPPKGRRGAAFGFTADDYLGGSVTDIIKVADERTLVMCLIETAEGVENVDEIAAVPGVDVLWLGHYDLTNFLGIPAQFDHPKYKESIRKMVAAAKKHGKVLACMTGDEKWSKEYWDLGFRLFCVGVDNFLLQSAIRSGMKTLHELAGKK